MLSTTNDKAVEMVTNMRADARVDIEVVAIGHGWVEVIEVVTIDGTELMRSSEPVKLYVSDRLRVNGAKLVVTHN